MGIIIAIFAIIVIIAAILLVAAVLLQPGKGDLSATFGGFSSQMGSMFGMQRTVTMLAKITKILAIVITALTLAINIFITKGMM
jgi:protein translocase SecG subunit